MRFSPLKCDSAKSLLDNSFKVKDAKVRPRNSVNGKKTNSVPLQYHHPPSSNAIGTHLSDLDCDSDSDSELYLPAVNEAIRMLDLDSQATREARPVAPSSTTRSSSRNSVPLLSLCHSSSTWPSVGYCSSLLQQFVAKSQSGEPPPPPPQLPPTLQLTKAARKSFAAIEKAPAPPPAQAPAEHELDVLVPMRGLDCHPSHVSPDSGIQSVAGSPFSLNSSPVHPGHINSQQPVISPCPPPSPPPPPVPPAPAAPAAPAALRGKKAARATAPVAARRRRSCRDTASALSSGLQKDSSFVQAIQRGLDAALRLTAQTLHNEKNDSLPLCSDRKRSRSSTIQSRKSCHVQCNAAPQEASEECPTRKRKKKRKKKEVEFSDVTLELLCKTLDRCTISRLSTSNLALIRKPWIFQCRRYPSVVKAKRKKTENDVKRRGKSKKTDVMAAIATQRSAPVSSAVELLLPLKKRHHLVPAAYESLPTVSQCVIEEAEEMKDASQEAVLMSRKRPVSGSDVETGDREAKKKVKSRKKSKKSMESDNDLPTIEEIIAAVTCKEPTKLDVNPNLVSNDKKKPDGLVTSDIQLAVVDEAPKKKNRRRKVNQISNHQKKS